MGPTATLARSSLRRRWRWYLGVVVLLGCTAGLSLFAIAGARRTQSSYPRFLRFAHASTLSVGLNRSYDAKQTDTVARFPEVVSSRTYVGLNAYVFERGRPDFQQSLDVTATFDGRYFDQDRFFATRGRRPDPSRAAEIAFNRYAADRFGFLVGQTLELGTYSQAQLSSSTFFASPPPPLARTTVRVVGIGLFPDEVVQDEADRTPRMLLTPAFTKAHADAVTYTLQGLVLAQGDADVATVVRRLEPFAPRGVQTFHLTSQDEFHAVQAIRPLSIALGIFGLITAAAAVVLVSQAIAALLRAEANDRLTLRAFGASPHDIVREAVIGPALAIVGGAVLAVLLAVLASPAMPIGPTRVVEVRQGFDVDATVLGFSVAAIVVVLLAVTVTVAWRTVPHRLASRRPFRRRPSFISAAAASTLLSPSGSTGLRLALERGDATSVPPRAVIGGAAVAIATLAGAVTFGASLSRLTSDARLYGWNWNATVVAGNGYGNLTPSVARGILDADPQIAAWTGAYFGSASLDGQETPLLGMDPGSRPQPSLLSGRPITNPSETVLGSDTAARLHAHVGNSVTWSDGTTSRSLTVVGIATLPTIGRTHGSRTSLGVGAIVDHHLVPGYDHDITGAPTGDLGPQAIFVRFHDGTNSKTELARLRTTTKPLAGFAGVDVLAVQRPAEIVNSSAIGSAPVVLASALALGALVSLGLALANSVRRRRFDLAVLRTLGFTDGQLAATVGWQATATVVVGLLIGIPLGIVLGRTLWRDFADQLDVVARPSTPVLALTAMGALMLLVGNAAALLPARRARRVNPAQLLQAP